MSKEEKKIIVVYRSKTGFCKTYAEWISAALKCECREGDTVTAKELDDYDVIIYGGGLYAVGINGISLIKKNLSQWKDKKIVVWATGSNPGRMEDVDQMWDFNFNSEERAVIKTFYLRGGFDYKLLGKKDKILMQMLKMRLKSKKELSEDEKGLLNAYSTPEYHCKEENIKELVEYVDNLS